MEQAQDSEALSRFIGHPALDLPTPSMVLSLPTLNRNIQTLLDDVKNLGIGFRAHVKTLKVIPSDHDVPAGRLLLIACG